jgi:hypothetical protein
MSKITHITVKQRTLKKREVDKCFDLTILGRGHVVGEERQYPSVEYVRLCTIIQLYDEDTCRLIRTWNVSGDRASADQEAITLPEITAQ